MQDDLECIVSQKWAASFLVLFNKHFNMSTQPHTRYFILLTSVWNWLLTFIPEHPRKDSGFLCSKSDRAASLSYYLRGIPHIIINSWLWRLTEDITEEIGTIPKASTFFTNVWMICGIPNNDTIYWLTEYTYTLTTIYRLLYVPILHICICIEASLCGLG